MLTIDSRTYVNTKTLALQLNPLWDWLNLYQESLICQDIQKQGTTVLLIEQKCQQIAITDRSYV